MINKIIDNKTDFKFDRSFSAIIGLEPSKGARSPILWNSAYKNFELNTQMHPLDVSEDNLYDLIFALNENTFFEGGAVAVPYKEKVLNIIKNLDNGKISEEASNIGAVNSIFRDGKNNICATNTDGEAALKSLVDKCENLKDKNVLLIGVGGAGKAVATYISNYLDKGKLFISARQNEKTRNFINLINASAVSWPIENFEYKNIDVLINCTILGSKTNNYEANSPLKDKFIDEDKIFQNISKDCLLFDIIYDPIETIFLKNGKQHALETINGLQMNLDQAVIAFNYATKNKYQLQDISNAMKNAS